MSGPVRVEDDGTRVYANGHRYRPVSPQDRVYRVRKPEDPRAVRFGGTWFVPLPLLDEETRRMPETRPDDETLFHPAWCRCVVCQRPQAAGLWRTRGRERTPATAASTPRPGRPGLRP